MPFFIIPFLLQNGNLFFISLAFFLGAWYHNLYWFEAGFTRFLPVSDIYVLPVSGAHFHVLSESFPHALAA